MERISLRAFGRLPEVNVSDTSIRKAIDAGRITPEAVTVHPTNGRPMLFKEKALKDWKIAGGGLAKELYSAKVEKVEADAKSSFTAKHTAPVPEGQMTITEARRRKAVYEADLKGLELARERGLLVSKSKVFEQLFAFAVEIKNGLETMPDKYLDLMLAAPDRGDANLIFKNAINEVLDRLSRAGEIKI